MFCEYCEVHLIDLADLRRHMLSMAHIRSKNSYELSMSKFFERRRQANMHPNNFNELCLSLNMHSGKDVTALEKDKFFKMERLWQYDVSEELMKVLMESGIKYSLNRISVVARKELIRYIEEERKAKKERQAEEERRAEEARRAKESRQNS